MAIDVGAVERRLDRALVESRFIYDPASGVLYWRNGRRAGLVAGYPHGKRGDRYVRIGDGTRKGELVAVHRIAWLLMTGDWPSGEIDHINRDSADNRFANLREAGRTLQCRNTGAEGVCRCKQTGKWKAYLSIGPKQIWLGRHATKAAAISARKAAEHQYWNGDERIA